MTKSAIVALVALFLPGCGAFPIGKRFEWQVPASVAREVSPPRVVALPADLEAVAALFSGARLRPADWEQEPEDGEVLVTIYRHDSKPFEPLFAVANIVTLIPDIALGIPLVELAREDVRLRAFSRTGDCVAERRASAWMLFVGTYGDYGKGAHAHANLEPLARELAFELERRR